MITEDYGKALNYARKAERTSNPESTDAEDTTRAKRRPANYPSSDSGGNESNDDGKKYTFYYLFHLFCNDKTN